MSNVYHGSCWRFLKDLLRDGVRSPRRVFREMLGLPHYPTAALERHFRVLLEMAERGDLTAATQYACTVAEEALQRGDAQTLSLMSRPLERLEAYGPQARYFRASRQLSRPVAKDWDGSALLDGTLVVDYKYRTVGLPLRHARLLAPAAARAKRCVALAERRLVPLYQRTFPDVELRAVEDDHAALFAAADAITTYTDLLAFFAPDAATIAASFLPLRADPLVRQELRRRYESRGTGPFIGLSWGSSNRAKDAPSFSHWSPLLQATPGTFVTLQYGDIERAMHKLGRWVPGRLLRDESVDQMRDMDRFASQVASLDAVISTSNTIAHLAGALGVPSVVVLNDNLYQVWPFRGATIAWNPRTVLIHKHGRAWPVVLQEAQVQLRRVLDAVAPPEPR
ncbi:MAG: hypothetical protein FJW40_18470 [Acidobacteria bacterium]|nr:hypothetical protein [Acidobacteriota bacterium]